MGRVRTVMVCVVFAVVMVAPLCMAVALSLGVSLPAWADGREARWLTGEEPGNGIEGSSALKQFVSGELQESIEAQVEASVPARAIWMLMYAALQRDAITASNSWFKWEAYPTFYGSTVAYCVDDDTLVGIPSTHLDTTSIESFASEFATYATYHPEINMVAYVISEKNDLRSNPVAKLMNVPDWGRLCQSTIEDKVDGIPNVMVLVQDYPDSSAYFDDYYRSDHHWNASGALRAASRISESLHLGPVKSSGRRFLGEVFIGSNMRSGLYPLADQVWDEDVDYSGMTVTIGDVSKPLDDHGDFFDLGTVERAFQFYGSYFGPLVYKTIHGGTGTTRGLLVTDSYGQSLARPLSTRFESLTVTGEMFYWDDSPATLSELLEKSDSSDVIFAAYLPDYQVFMKNHPRFFR